MSARVHQVNLSSGGIPKRPVADALATAEGFVGDAWNHPQLHGGRRQALLILTLEGIAELAELGFPIAPGTLGENVTVSGLDRRAMRFGQRYAIGEAIVELTKMRGPCATLNPLGPGIQAALYDAQVKGGDPSSPRLGAERLLCLGAARGRYPIG